MRRIVAGEPDDGGSRVISATTVGTERGPSIFRLGGGLPETKLEAIPDELSSSDLVAVHLWESLGPELATVGVDAAAGVADYVFVPGLEGLFWRYHVWGPGFSSAAHTTETLDLMFVISGEVTLILDREDVLLQSGDALVLQAASHGWRAGDEGCTFIHLMRRLS